MQITTLLFHGIFSEQIISVEDYDVNRHVRHITGRTRVLFWRRIDSERDLVVVSNVSRFTALLSEKMRSYYKELPRSLPDGVAVINRGTVLSWRSRELGVKTPKKYRQQMLEALELR